MRHDALDLGLGSTKGVAIIEMLLDCIVHAFPEASFAHDVVCDTESRMVVVCRVVKVAQYTWDEAVGEKQCSIAVRGCSARLQCMFAARDCIARLQCTVAVRDCIARLQCAVAVRAFSARWQCTIAVRGGSTLLRCAVAARGCSARAIVSSEPMRAR